MKEEILAAVMFLIRFIEKSDSFPRDQIENFKNHLTALLTQRFEKHWFPEVPAKGQGYRCIRVNGLTPVDITLEKAASRCGLTYSDLRLPTELTVWVDPSEVCYRLGESEGSYCTLATFPSDSSSECSTPSPSPPSTPMQEKQRRVHKQTSRTSLDGAIKHRNYMNVAAIRVKPVPREDIFETFCSVHLLLSCSYSGEFNKIREEYSCAKRNSVNCNKCNWTKFVLLSFNMYQNRPPWRCDGPPFPVPPAMYRNMNYNTRHYKNILRV